MSVFSPPKKPTRHYVSLPPCGQTMDTTLNSPYWYFGTAIAGNAIYWMVPPISSGTFYLTGFTLMCDNDSPPASGTIQIKRITQQTLHWRRRIVVQAFKFLSTMSMPVLYLSKQEKSTHIGSMEM